MKNLFAHTEAHNPLPAFVSISRNSEGAHSISVRSRGQQYASVIDVSPEVLELLAAELMAKLNESDPS